MKSFVHPTSATFAKDFSDQTNNPSRLYPDAVGAWRPLREPSPTPHAKSVKAATHTSKLHSHFRTLRSSARFTETKQSRAAFSLTEVVIAMGVAAVAFTSIIALFPLGLNMSKESYEATQAALVAQTILADLKDALSGGSNVKLIQQGGQASVFNSANYTNITLLANNSTTYYLAFDQQPRTDSPGSPIILRPYIFSSSLPTWYRDGTNTASLIVRVIVEKTFVPDSGSNTNPQKVEVSVESPGSAKATNRTQWVFQGVVNAS